MEGIIALNKIKTSRADRYSCMSCSFHFVLAPKWCLFSHCLLMSCAVIGNELPKHVDDRVTGNQSLIAGSKENIDVSFWFKFLVKATIINS